VATLTNIQKESRERRKERYDQAVKAASELSVPENMAAQLEGIGGGMTDVPQLKLAIAMRVQAATQYLHSQIPKDPLAGHQLSGKSPWRPSDQQQATFLRKLEAVNNPVAVIESIPSGTVTPDQIDAIRTVHPEIYAELQKTMMNAIMEAGDKMPYERRLLIGNLLQIPADYALNPKFIAQMQQPFAREDQGGRPEGSTDSQPRRKTNVDVNPFATVATDVDRLSYGDME
jgi:hypothetical protein